MALSAAEKQRRYRQKRDADPEKRAKWLTYQKQKYQKDKHTRKRKLVRDMTGREHRLAKKQWRKYKKDSNEQKKQTVNLLSPPASVSGSPPSPPAYLSRQRRAVNKKIEKLRVQVVSLQKEVSVQQKKIWMYEKRLQRKENKNTPNSKAAKLVGRKTVSNKTVRRTLAFHFSLLEQMKLNQKKGKKKLREVFTANDSILKKYGFRTRACKALRINPYHRPHPKNNLSNRVRLSVRQFFLRDDVSTVKAGVKNTITRRKVKKQKRVLYDSLKNLYQKYQEDSGQKVSFTTFWRLKPFWVLPPTLSDRDTCLCKTCENTKYLAAALRSAGVFKTSLTDLVSQIVCSKDNKQCMYRSCTTCHSKTVSRFEDLDFAQEVSWVQWRTIKEERTFKNGEKKQVTVTTKQTEQGTLGKLWDIFHDQLSMYTRHCFNKANQYKHYMHVKTNMKPNECMVHIDFSENYVCKMHKQIQGIHYGASQVQITLHTGFYLVEGTEKLFCGVSDSLQHDPSSVWAFLRPVLHNIRRAHPLVDTVHFFSDGPTTQYRQKGNFYLLATEIFHCGFKWASWNFSEAGHGKGVPDGVGGTLKRTADRKVVEGADIMSSWDFVDKVSKCTSIHLYNVTETDIKEVEKRLYSNAYAKTLKTVPGTMQIHQVFVVSPENIKVRDVSCTCIENTCSDHSLRDVCVSPWGSECNTCKRKTSDGIKMKAASGPSTASRPKTENEQGGREKEFKDHLDRLETAKTFNDLQKVCSDFDLGDSLQGEHRYIQRDGLKVDYQGLQLYPSDIISAPSKETYPVTVKADGNCLPRSGSVFAFGNENKHPEVRVRIIHELALNSEYYLNEDNMRKGLPRERGGKVLNAWTMYSDEYAYGQRIDENSIRETYVREVMKLHRLGSYMGMWQIAALASVLKMPIFSAYPQLGNPRVRSDLHRLLLPRIVNTKQDARDPLIIMWSSTRNDMKSRHWVPNHLMPAVSQAPTEGTQCQDQPNCEQASSARLDSDHEVPLPEECLGKWVIVEYDKNPYPGFVQDVDAGDLYINCMHSVGKSVTNCFFWPKQFKDVCWYEHNKVLYLIPEPLLKTGSSQHYSVDPAIWELILSAKHDD